MEIEVIDEEIKLDGEGTNITPRSEESRKKFPYYCPICLCFYKKIKITNCCKNSCCDFCLSEINKRVVEEEEEGEGEDGGGVICPFCNSRSFEVKEVKEIKQVRKYFSSGNLDRRPSEIEVDKVNEVVVDKERISPIRPGDSYDDLKRKMILREIDGYYKIEQPPSLPPPPVEKEKKKKKKKKNMAKGLKKITKGIGKIFSFSCCSVDTSMVIDTEM